MEKAKLQNSSDNCKQSLLLNENCSPLDNNLHSYSGLKNSLPCDCFVHKSEQHRNKEYKSLKKRAIRNYLSVKIKVALVELTNSPLHFSYLNSLTCTKVLVQVGDELKSLYCGARWCPVCGAIRTAKMIEGYLPVIQKFNDPRYVTVSLPSPYGYELRDTVKKMTKEVKKITDYLRKAHNIKLKAVKKIECTFNEKTGTYHPHLSFIIDKQKVADLFINEWLIRFPDASRSGQYHKKADKNTIKELFKYTVKLVAGSEIEVKALDVIFCSLFGMRTIQGIGIKKVPDEKKIMENLTAQKIEIKPDSVIWLWVQEKSDWFNEITGEGLTGCQEYKKKQTASGMDGPEIVSPVKAGPVNNLHIVGEELKERVSSFEVEKRYSKK